MLNHERMQALKSQYHTAIICRTPLQSLLATQIASMRPDEDFIFVYISQSRNAKNILYFNQVDFDKLYFEWHRSTGSHTLDELITALRVVYSLRRVRILNIIGASIGTFELSILAAIKENPRIYTYDDGTFNFTREISRDWIWNEPRIRRLLKALMGGFSIAKLVRESEIHYTVFDPSLSSIPFRTFRTIDLSSMIASRSSQVSRMTGQSLKLTSQKKKIRILLGTFFFNSAEQKHYEKLLSRFPYDVYIPHPEFDDSNSSGREIHKIDDRLVVSNLVAEDCIAYLKSRGYTIVLYGFCSTALLTCSIMVRSVSLMIGASHERSFERVARAMRVKCLHCYEPPATL